MFIGADFYHNKCGDDKNPMKRAHNNWMNQRRDTGWPGRPSWDPVTVYAAIVGTQAAQMWEEKGTNRIDAAGHENWDKSTTNNNEVHLWFLNNDRKPGVVKILNDIICAGNNQELMDKIVEKSNGQQKLTGKKLMDKTVNELAGMPPASCTGCTGCVTEAAFV